MILVELLQQSILALSRAQVMRDVINSSLCLETTTWRMRKTPTSWVL